MAESSPRDGASSSASSAAAASSTEAASATPVRLADNETAAGARLTHEAAPLLSVRITEPDGRERGRSRSGSGSSGSRRGSHSSSGCNTPSGRRLSLSLLDADGIPLPSPFSPQPMVFKLYSQRWYVLGLFSLMALLNNAICYTVGSVHRVSRRYYYAGVGPVDNEESTYDLATLVTIYFLTYVTFSFPTSWFVERWGLKAGVLVGAWLQAAGCFVRVMGTPIIAAQEDFGPPIDERAHGNLWFVLVGQIIASLGQAFFVNPPPLLAAIWFGVNERTLATTIACNANTLGIALAYMAGPAMVDSVDDLPEYMWACFLAALACAAAATLYFPAAPPTPPSHSQVEPALARAFPSPSSSSPTEEEIAAAAQLRNNNNCSTSVGSLSTSPPEMLSSSPEHLHHQLPHQQQTNHISSSDEDVECGVHRHLLGHSHSASGYGAMERAHGDSAGGVVGHSRSDSLLLNGVGGRSSNSNGRHVRAQSQNELAVARSFAAMSSPPCSFVRSEAILAERSRADQASRILASLAMFKAMFSAPGFMHTLLVFGVAEANINGFATFMFLIMEPWGYQSMQLVGGMVCAFIVLCMLGSAVIGWLVDRSKAFKTWIVLSLLGSALALLYLILAGPFGLVHIWTSICLLGFFMGPLQPLSIETGVEVAYPAPESSVTAVQQVLGNLFSAALFPLILLCRSPVTRSMQAALLLFLFCLLGVALFYLSFDGHYRRLEHERERETAHRELHKRLHEEEHRKKVQDARRKRAEQIARANAATTAAAAATNQEETTEQRHATASTAGARTPASS